MSQVASSSNHEVSTPTDENASSSQEQAHVSTPLISISHYWPVISLAVLLTFLLLWAMPLWQISGIEMSARERLLTANTLRDTWAKILSTFLLLLAAYYTWRYVEAMGRTVAAAERTTAAAEKSAAISSERHITERFVRVMELLGDDKLEVRLGGIYALERIARDSPNDQNAVTEVLATYVREHAPWHAQATHTGRVRADVQAILTVLGRRAWADGEEETLDLHGTALATAYLPFARLQRAFLYETNLRGAMLYNADLRGAWLWKAHLHDTILEGAHLEGADLTAAEGLTWEQLRQTHLNKATKLPDYLRASIPDDIFNERGESTPVPVASDEPSPVTATAASDNASHQNLPTKTTPDHSAANQVLPSRKA